MPQNCPPPHRTSLQHRNLSITYNTHIHVKILNPSLSVTRVKQRGLVGCHRRLTVVVSIFKVAVLNWLLTLSLFRALSCRTKHTVIRVASLFFSLSLFISSTYFGSFYKQSHFNQHLWYLQSS